VLLMVGAFTVPSVRAGAKAFLDLFRVVNFAPVAVTPETIKQLGDDAGKLDLAQMFGGKVEVLQESGPPRNFATLSEASEAAGIRVRTPSWMPAELSQTGEFAVTGDYAARVQLDVPTLQQFVDSVGVDDLRVPESLDGQSLMVHLTPVVHVRYSDGKGERGRSAHLVQARRPEATLPAGTDLATLAEIVLRILGVERAEAHRFAQTVDWRTTLIVPIPMELASFRQIDVQGNSGLMIQTNGRKEGDRYIRPSTQIIWSSGDSVYAMIGNVRTEELFEMAQSVQ